MNGLKEWKNYKEQSLCLKLKTKHETSFSKMSTIRGSGQ